MAKSQSKLVQSHIVEPSNSAQSEDDAMTISQWEYAADLVRFAIGSSAIGLNAIAIAIKRGIEHWLSEAESDVDNISSSATVAEIVGADEAPAAIDLLRSDVEAMTGGTIIASASEKDGHHTPDQLAKRWLDRWHG